MSKLIAINGAEMTATFRSGILVYILEKSPNEKGYTLGHFFPKVLSIPPLADG
ncbi:MAG: hypothetical protein IPH74_03125 [Bacteroidetes bacterium]|nr:hypothetical protein [Bacteroidota bacterium]